MPKSGLCSHLELFAFSQWSSRGGTIVKNKSSCFLIWDHWNLFAILSAKLIFKRSAKMCNYSEILRFVRLRFKFTFDSSMNSSSNSSEACRILMSILCNSSSFHPFFVASLTSSFDQWKSNQSILLARFVSLHFMIMKAEEGLLYIPKLSDKIRD